MVVLCMEITAKREDRATSRRNPKIAGTRIKDDSEILRWASDTHRSIVLRVRKVEHWDGSAFF